MNDFMTNRFYSHFITLDNFITFLTKHATEMKALTDRR